MAPLSIAASRNETAAGCTATARRCTGLAHGNCLNYGVYFVAPMQSARETWVAVPQTSSLAWVHVVVLAVAASMVR